MLIDKCVLSYYVSVNHTHMRLYLLLLLAGMLSVVKAQEVPMFVGTYTHTGSQGVYLYMFDESTADATMYSVTSSSNPSFLARSSDGKMLYAVNQNRDSSATLSSFSFDGDALSFIDAIPTGGTSPCHVAVSTRYPLAVTADYDQGTLSVYRLGADGMLLERVQTLTEEGRGPDSTRQEHSHVHSAFFSPDEQQVFVQNLGTDKVTIYNVYEWNGHYRLIKDREIATPAGGGPRHLVFDEAGQNFYLLLEMAGQIAHYQLHGEDWQLLDTVSINADDFIGENRAAEIKRSADGKFIYASNRGDANSIALFSVGQQGRLTRKAVYPTGGEGPRNFNLSPDGKFVLVAHEESNNITIFHRDEESGELSLTDKQIDVASPVCILF